MTAEQAIARSEELIGRLNDRARWERLSMAVFARGMRKAEAEARAHRISRLAEKWGARVVAGGRVVREGGAR